MKQIRTYPVPLYGPGSIVIQVPVSGVIKDLGVDAATGDWFVGVEVDLSDGYFRHIELHLTDQDAAVESSFNWIGHVVLNGITYSAWWREAG